MPKKDDDRKRLEAEFEEKLEAATRLAYGDKRVDEVKGEMIEAIGTALKNNPEAAKRAGKQEIKRLFAEHKAALEAMETPTDTTTDSGDCLIGDKAIAARYNVKPRTVKDWRFSKGLPYEHTSTGRVKVKVSDLEKWLNTEKTPSRSNLPKKKS